MKIKQIILPTSIFLIIIIALVGCNSGNSDSSNEKGEEIELKAVTALEENAPDNEGMFDFIDKVNELGEGKIHIEYLGGPEAVPTDQQPKSIEDGTVDISWIPSNYMSSITPAANALQLSTITGEEERETELYDLWNDVFEKANARFLLRGSSPDVKFHFYTNKPVESLDDFKSLQMRSSETYQDILTTLGAEPVSLTPDEIYTALQRGTVDGFGWPGFGLQDFAWDEETEYMIDPGFYQFDVIGLMNLDAWEDLPDETKDIINEAAVEVENDMVEHFEDLEEKNRDNLEDQGAEIVELDQEEADELIEISRDTMWDKILDGDKELGSKIKEELDQ